MSYTVEREITFNNTCAAINYKLLSVAKKITEAYGCECPPGAVVGIFLEALHKNFETIPDSEFKSSKILGDYLLGLFETGEWQLLIDENEWPSLSGAETKSADMLNMSDIQGSGYVVTGGIGNPHPRVSYAGPDVPQDTDDILFLPFTRVIVPIDIHAVEKMAETMPRY